MGKLIICSYVYRAELDSLLSVVIGTQLETCLLRYTPRMGTLQVLVPIC